MILLFMLLLSSFPNVCEAASRGGLLSKLLVCGGLYEATVYSLFTIVRNRNRA
jgi:hypothetical protein